MRVNLMGIASSSICEDFFMHSHENWEIILNLSGSGFDVVAGNEYPFQHGSIVCIPPLAMHGKRMITPYRDIFIEIESLNFDHGNEVLSFNDDDERSVESLMMIALKVFFRNQSNQKQLLNALAESICHLLSSWKTGYNNKDIDRFINLLVENFTNPELKIGNAMEQVPYNGDYFRRYFKKTTGYTPIEYLTKLRMDYAEKLMSQHNTGQTITGIASMVGYYDPDYFSRVFKRKFGVAPSEYTGNRYLRGKSGAKLE